MLTATRNLSELRNSFLRLLVAATPISVACWHCKHKARTSVSGLGEYCSTAVDIGHGRAARARMCVCGRCLRKVSSRACNSLCARGAWGESAPGNLRNSLCERRPAPRRRGRTALPWAAAGRPVWRSATFSQGLLRAVARSSAASLGCCVSKVKTQLLHGLYCCAYRISRPSMPG